MPELTERDRHAVTEYFERLRAVIDGTSNECLVCGQHVATYAQWRTCVYALPCRHRQWQGELPRARG